MRKRSRRILKKFHEDIRDLFSIVILKNINKLDDWHCPMSVLWAESLSVYIHVVYARPGCATGHFAQDLVGYATARLDWIRPDHETYMHRYVKCIKCTKGPRPSLGIIVARFSAVCWYIIRPKSIVLPFCILWSWVRSESDLLAPRSHPERVRKPTRT